MAHTRVCWLVHEIFQARLVLHQGRASISRRFVPAVGLSKRDAVACPSVVIVLQYNKKDNPLLATGVVLESQRRTTMVSVYRVSTRLPLWVMISTS
jgi:hypothetical protein